MSGEIGILIKGNASQLKTELAGAGASVKDFGDKSEKFLQKGGISAKQMAFQLRGIPAQFTDIVVSLQAGQKPLTVLLQQGGQLKDMFGGVGPAAKALGGYIIGLVNPYTVAAAAAAALGYAWYKGAAESGEYNKAMILSGNTAGTTAAQMQAMARNIAASSSASTGSAADAVTQFVRNGDIASGKIQSFASTAVSMQQLTGVAVADTVKQFAELGKAPVDASLKLNETTGYLTAGVYEQIKALMEQGRTLEAGALAQQTYADAMNSRMPQLEDNLLRIEKWWHAISKSAKEAWSSMISASDPATMLSARLATLQGSDKYANGSYMGGPAVGNEIADLQEKIKYYDHIAASSKDYAAAQAAQNKQLDATVSWDKLHDQYLSKAEQKQREINKATQDYHKPGVEGEAGKAQQYLDILEGIDKKFKDDKSKASEYDKLSDAIARELSLSEEELKYGGKLAASDKYRVQTLDKIQNAYANGEITMLEWSKLYDAIDKTADRKLEAETIEKVSKATEQANKERQSELDTIGKSTATLQDQIRAQQDHNAGIGQTAEAIAALTSQRELDKASTLQGIAIKDLDRNLDYQKYDAVMAEVAAMRTLAAEKAHGGVLETADKSAKASADEWKKGWEETDRIARESFTSWADGGKSAAKVIGDALKKSLLSAIYEATIRPIALQLYTSITGGPGGAATAGQGGMGLLSGLSTASGLSTLGSAIGTGISGAVGSSIGAVFGTTAGNTAIGMTMGATSAESLAAASAASVAGGGVAAGEGLTAAATGLGAIPVWGWAALGVMALVGSGVFGGGGGPKTESGSGIGLDTRQSSLGGPIGDYVKGLETGYANAATQLGIAGTMKAGAFTAVDTAGDSKTQLQVAASVNGQTVYDRNKIMGGIENVGRTPEELAAAMGLEASRAVFAALQASTLPKYLSGVFDGLSAGAMTQAQVDTAMAAAQSFKLMHDQLQALPFAYLQDMSYATSKTLTDLAGGMQAFGTSLATYYDKFYTADEKTAQLTKNTTDAFAAIGIVMPQVDAGTRAWYRSEVDRLGAMDLGVAANAHAYTAALALATAVDTLAPTFDSVQAAAKSTADAAIKAAQDAAKATADLAKTNKSLQDQLDILTGKQTANSVALRDATDVTTAVLLAQVDAQTKLNDATTQAASDAKALKDALTSAGGGLSAFVQTLRGATQASSLTQTRAAYNADLTLAQAGNVDASNRLPSSGKAYLDAQTALAASAVDVQRASALMANQLGALPATQSYEQKMLDAVNATTQSVTDLNGKLVTELTVTARSEIVKAISVIGSSDLSGDLQKLALLATETVSHTIDIIGTSDLSDELKKLALLGSADILRLISIIGTSDLTADLMKQAFGSTTDISRYIEIVAGNTLLSGDLKAKAFGAGTDLTRTLGLVTTSTSMSDTLKSEAFGAASDLTRTLGIVAGFKTTDEVYKQAFAAGDLLQRAITLAESSAMPPDLKLLALGQADTDFKRTISALGGTLTDEQKLLLNGQTDYKKLVLINTVVATSASAAPVADQPVSSASAYTLSSITSSGGPYTKLTAPDGSLVTWGSGFSGGVLANVLTNIQTIDTLSASMHTAIATYGHDISLPGFAVGTNSVPYDMTANIHKDERIIPAADNRELMTRLRSPQGNNEALVAEIRASREEAKALREEVRELRASVERGNANTQLAADRLSGRQGVPFLVQVAP